MTVVASAVAMAACTNVDGPDAAVSTTEPVAQVPEVTVPPTRLTPFCQAMIDLDEALPIDQTVDTRRQVLEAYRAALPVVPAEIEEQFRAVIADLDDGVTVSLPSPGELTPGTTGPPITLPLTTDAAGPTTLPTEEELAPEEGFTPDDDPAAQVNAYIDFACRGTVNNPGPAATVPGGPPPTTTE